MYKNILSGLVPRNDRSLSSHSISSCHFSLSFHFQAHLQGVRSQKILLHSVKMFKMGLFCILKVIPPSCISKKVPKYVFWGIFLTSVNRVVLMKSMVEVAIDRFDEDAVLIKWVNALSGIEVVNRISVY